MEITLQGRLQTREGKTWISYHSVQAKKSEISFATRRRNRGRLRSEVTRNGKRVQHPRCQLFPAASEAEPDVRHVVRLGYLIGRRDEIPPKKGALIPVCSILKYVPAYLIDAGPNPTHRARHGKARAAMVSLS